MSRMQNILDKAERDGAVLRIRPLADQVAFDTPPPSAVPPPANYAAVNVAAQTPIRPASPRLLDRALVAAEHARQAPAQAAPVELHVGV